MYYVMIASAYNMGASSLVDSRTLQRVFGLYGSGELPDIRSGETHSCGSTNE